VRSIAVVDPIGNAGGGSRFTRSLLLAIRAVRPDLAIRFVGNKASMKRDGLDAEFDAAGIEIVRLNWTLGGTPNAARPTPTRRRPLAARLVRRVRRKVGLLPKPVPRPPERSLSEEIAAATDGVDIAYFPWPYKFTVPALSCPMVTTVHDLNFRYFFGMPVFSRTMALELDEQIALWLETATVVTSSRFMADEIEKHFAGVRPPKIIRLAAFAGTPGPIDMRARHGRYIICSTHLVVHKNLGALIAALALLRPSHPDLRLLVTGVGTDQGTGRASAIGTVRTEVDPDVVGLGYVSNSDMDALTTGALVVANPSLYEGGNGPGLDAWFLGTPVAMSDIPSFREHLTELGVEAALFDPRSPTDIAAKIGSILEHPNEWSQRAARSMTAIRERTWEVVAREYLAVFEGAVALGGRE
jgi:glycosyltransferase involved in cell wall biosynthesis